jgi:hypothetical protein
MNRIATHGEPGDSGWCQPRADDSLRDWAVDRGRTHDDNLTTLRRRSLRAI